MKLHWTSKTFHNTKRLELNFGKNLCKIWHILSNHFFSFPRAIPIPELCAATDTSFFFFFFSQQLHTTMFLKLHKYLPFMDTGYLYSNKSIAFIQVYRTLVQSNRVLFLLYKLSIDWCMLGGLCDTGVGIRTTLTIWTEDRENLLLMLDKIYRKKDV